MLLEQQLIEHCAPALAGIKTANLFNCSCPDIHSFYQELQRINALLSPKGVRAEVLRVSPGRALLYVFRKRQLEADLSRNGVHDLLQRYGYPDRGISDCIRHLCRRLDQADCFPHEIGLFLGYPLEDVLGFIRHRGKNCKCCGVWKVYCDEHEKRKLFARFRRCTQVYVKSFAAGRTLEQMTVSLSV